jgi:hypothetical protein
MFLLATKHYKQQPLCIMNKKIQINHQHGSVIILSGFAILALIGIVAFVIDFGNFYLKKTRLKNIADVAAIAGVDAVYIDKYGSNWELDPNIPIFVKNTLNANYYANTGTIVTETTTRDELTGAVITKCNVGRNNICIGAWRLVDLDTGNGSITVSNPSVKVTINDDAPFNFANLLFNFINNNNFTVSSTATTGPPATGKGTIPLAIADCAVFNGFDATTGKPKIDPATNQPYNFQLGVAGVTIGGGTCTNNTGIWTSFTTTNTNTGTVGGFMPTHSNGNQNSWTWTPPATTALLSVPNNTTIYTTNGSLASSYSQLSDCFNFTGATYPKNTVDLCKGKMILAIIGTPGPPNYTTSNGYLVSPGTGAPSNQSSFPIVGFVCVQLTAVTATTQVKSIYGSFTTGCITSGTIGQGAYYGIAVPPVLGM